MQSRNEHPLHADPLNIDTQTSSATPPPTQTNGNQRTGKGQTKVLPRSVRWRLSLGVLTKLADDDTKTTEELLKSIENLNALKLRCQRSRYEDIEMTHYWKSTPTCIADDTIPVGGVDDEKNGVKYAGSHLEGLHHVAPGDDPLSALVQSAASINRADNKKGLFGGNGIFGANKTRSRTTSDGSRSSWKDSGDVACKGSRWSEFYNTREVLDVIEKDLDRLPSDHYTIFHQCKTRIEGEGKDKNFHSKQDNCAEFHFQKGEKRNKYRAMSWSLGQMQKGESTDNLLAMLEDNKRKQDENANAAAIQASIKERAGRMSQILFVYAKCHPDIGYRQGMHEVLSYILLAFEMDMLEYVNFAEGKSGGTDSFSSKGKDSDGGRAGVDSSGKIVVVRLLDPEYILHDAFSLFECIMTSLAHAYDAVPAGDETAQVMLEEARVKRGESPMESMTSSIVSKIRFVARDEQLFSFILYMPVPPQLYFAKWIRLMFGREVAGGIKNVMRLWEAFFDLASARASVEEVPISIALLDVLKVAACGMILLIRPLLLAPTMTYGGMMTGDPDPESGISFLMNYPPIQDIQPLLETMSDLLAKEKKISNEYYYVSKERKLSKQFALETIPAPKIIHDPSRSNCIEYHSQNLSQREVPPSSRFKEDVYGNDNRKNDDRLRLYRTEGSTQTLHQIHDVAESIGNIAGGILDFGSKTASIAIANIQKQYEAHRHAIDHPLQKDTISSKVNGPGSAGRIDDFSIAYRPHAPNSLEWNTVHVANAVVDESDDVEGDKKLEKTPTDVAHHSIAATDFIAARIGKLHTSEHRETCDADSDAGEEYDGSFSPKFQVTTCIEESTKKNPKELANMLDRSVTKLMNHFQGSLAVPHEIWDAMADIDAVKKELLQQAAITSFSHVRNLSEE